MTRTCILLNRPSSKSKEYTLSDLAPSHKGYNFRKSPRFAFHMHHKVRAMFICSWPFDFEAHLTHLALASLAVSRLLRIVSFTGIRVFLRPFAYSDVSVSVCGGCGAVVCVMDGTVGG